MGGSPFFEFFTVGIIFDPADHEIRQMTILVRNRIEKPIFNITGRRISSLKAIESVWISPSSSMIFSASSIEAWWRDVVETVSSSSFFVRRVSLLHFARPAVERSLLLHTIRIPPAEAANAAIWPLVIFSSTSFRKEVARSYFFSLNNFRRWISSLSLFTGVLIGDLRGDADGEGSDSPSSSMETILLKRSVCGVFLGEY